MKLNINGVLFQKRNTLPKSKEAEYIHYTT